MSFLYSSDELKYLLIIGQAQTLTKQAQNSQSWEQTIVQLDNAWKLAQQAIQSNTTLTDRQKSLSVFKSQTISDIIDSIKTNLHSQDVPAKLQQLVTSIDNFYQKEGTIPKQAWENARAWAEAAAKRATTEVSNFNSQTKANEDYLRPKIVSALLDRLQQQVQAKSEEHANMPTHVGTLNKNLGSVQPTVQDLSSLENFIGFLAKNEITYQGKLIATMGENKNAPKTPVTNSPNLPVQTILPLKKENSLNFKQAQTANILPGQEGDYKNFGGIFWVNPELLKSFVHDLQTNAAKSNNNLFIHMIGGREGLLDQINSNNNLSIKIDNKIPELQKQFIQQQSQEKDEQEFQEVGDLPSNTVVDAIPNPVILDNYRTKGGSVPLMLKDLQSAEAFSAWISKYSLQYKNNINDTQANDVSDTDDYCKIIFYLDNRSKIFDVAKSKAFQYYQKLIKNLQKIYNCPLSEEELSKQQSGDKKIQQVSWKPGDPLSSQQLQLLAPIASKYPLLQDRIDFNRISTWCQNFATILSRVKPMTPAISQQIANVNAVNSNISAIASRFGTTTQPLSTTALALSETIVSRTKNINGPGQYLASLRELIADVGSAISGFKSVYYDSLPQDWKEEIDKQISDSGSSYYEINWNRINDWVAELPKALQQVKK